jgi:hypothetical protein
MIEKERPLYDDFNAVAIVRTSIVFNGIQLDPSNLRLVYRCYAAVMSANVDTTKPADEQDWALFTLYEGSNCLLHRLILSDWFVNGIVAMEGEDYPVENVPIGKWTENLINVYVQMPRVLQDEYAHALAMSMNNAHDKAPKEKMDKMQMAIIQKGQALQALEDGRLNIHCPTIEDLEKIERTH